MLTRHDPKASVLAAVRPGAIKVYDFMVEIANVGPEVLKQYVSGFSFSLTQLQAEAGEPSRVELSMDIHQLDTTSYEALVTNVTRLLDYDTVQRVLKFFDVTETQVTKINFSMHQGELAELAVTTYIGQE